MGDVGITAQRYSLVLYGTSQQLKIEPWEPETQRTVTVPFAWKPDTWYRLKLRVENLPNGQVRAQGKAWAVGEPEPAAWMIDKIDPIGNRQGAPGLFIDAPVRRVSRQLLADARTDDETMTSSDSQRPVLAALSRSSRSSLVRSAPAQLAASDPGTGDWPMWGGTPDRNMVSNMKDLPTEWDVKTKKNMKWVADLGSQSYGNPVVAGGMVFVGTNNELLRDPKQAGDRGVLMAFRESDGEFLWQQTHAEARGGPRQRLAVPGRRLVAARRGRAALLRQQPRRGVLPRHPGLPRQRERRPGQGREADRARSTPTSSGRST